MNRQARYRVLAATALLVPLVAAAEAPALETEKQKLSYALGMQAGKSLRKYSLEVEPPLLMRGFNDALDDKPLFLSDSEARALLTRQRAQLRARTTASTNSVTPTATPDSASVGRPAAAARLELSYKIDPRLTQGLYMGERWVSLPKYVGARGQHAVDVRVATGASLGTPAPVAPKWIPSDPRMVTVTPAEGTEVKITVHRPGESTLQVVGDGMSKALTVKAITSGEVMKLEIHERS